MREKKKKKKTYVVESGWQQYFCTSAIAAVTLYSFQCSIPRTWSTWSAWVTDASAFCTNVLTSSSEMLHFAGDHTSRGFANLGGGLYSLVVG